MTLVETPRCFEKTGFIVNGILMLGMNTAEGQKLGVALLED